MMLELVRGCVAPRPELLKEQYQAGESGMLANVNAGKIQAVFRHFLSMHIQPLFFILELPATMQQEGRLRKTDRDPMHKDVYYIDGLAQSQALALLDQAGPLLIPDGISQFGFGCHDGAAELMKESYNILRLWYRQPEPYVDFFRIHSIPQAERCLTAWDTFTRQTPGRCFRVEMEGKTVFDLPEELADWGIYLAERREN